MRGSTVGPTCIVHLNIGGEMFSLVRPTQVLPVDDSITSSLACHVIILIL